MDLIKQNRCYYYAREGPNPEDLSTSISAMSFRHIGD